MICPLPSISQVYSMLIQEENQREIRSADHFLADSTSLAAEVNKPQQFHRGRMAGLVQELIHLTTYLKEMMERNSSSTATIARSRVIPLRSAIDFMVFHQITSSEVEEE